MIIKNKFETIKFRKIYRENEKDDEIIIIAFIIIYFISLLLSSLKYKKKINKI